MTTGIEVVLYFDFLCSLWVAGVSSGCVNDKLVGNFGIVAVSFGTDDNFIFLNTGAEFILCFDLFCSLWIPDIKPGCEDGELIGEIGPVAAFAGVICILLIGVVMV